MDKVHITVCLNGTDSNPFHRWGLKQNPFPMVGRYEYNEADKRLRSLGGDPIPDEAHIRKTLKGFRPDFIELCCQKFKRGQYVTFDVVFDADYPRWIEGE